MAGMMQSMQDPAYKSKVEDALKSLKEDPDLKPMLDELETAGPAAMMKKTARVQEGAGNCGTSSHDGVRKRKSRGIAAPAFKGGLAEARKGNAWLQPIGSVTQMQEGSLPGK
eukprot:538336-Pelagomonas_calceolata.AAC.1